MRYLVGLMLTLLPISGHTADSIPFPTDGIDQNTAERVIPDQSSGDLHPDDQPWPYANPYDPSSPTNFHAFIAPLASLSDGDHGSGLSPYRSDSGPSPAVYGHFGSPFFPDSVNRRNETDHPYALDSPTNQYGRSWFTEKR